MVNYFAFDKDYPFVIFNMKNKKIIENPYVCKMLDNILALKSNPKLFTIAFNHLENLVLNYANYSNPIIDDKEKVKIETRAISINDPNDDRVIPILTSHSFDKQEPEPDQDGYSQRFEQCQLNLRKHLKIGEFRTTEALEIPNEYENKTEAENTEGLKIELIDQLSELEVLKEQLKEIQEQEKPIDEYETQDNKVNVILKEFYDYEDLESIIKPNVYRKLSSTMTRTLTGGKKLVFPTYYLTMDKDLYDQVKKRITMSSTVYGYTRNLKDVYNNVLYRYFTTEKARSI